MNVCVYLIEWLASFIECFICFDIIHKVCTNQKKYRVYVCSVIVFLITSILNTFNIFSNITVILSLLIIPITAFLILKAEFYSAFLITTTYILILGMLDMFIICGLSIIFRDTDYILKIISSNNISRVIFLIIIKTIWVVLYLIFKSIIIKVNITYVKNKLYFFCISVIWLLQQAISVILVSNKLENMKIGLCISWMIFIVIIILITYFSIKTGELIRQNEKMKYLEIRNSSLESQFIKTNEMYKENAKIAHEFYHHLSILREMAYNKDYMGIIDYTENIKKEKKYIRTIFTGNKILDIVLNVKKIEADEKNISFITNINYPINCTISDTDICSLSSNIIDNAIDACSNTKDKSIALKIINNNNTLIIKQTNSSNQNPILSNFKSNKGLNHGLGTEIIENIVYKYNGTIEYSYSKGYLTTIILLYW